MAYSNIRPTKTVDDWLGQYLSQLGYLKDLQDVMKQSGLDSLKADYDKTASDIAARRPAIQEQYLKDVRALAAENKLSSNAMRGELIRMGIDTQGAGADRLAGLYNAYLGGRTQLGQTRDEGLRGVDKSLDNARMSYNSSVAGYMQEYLKELLALERYIDETAYGRSRDELGDYLNEINALREYELIQEQRAYEDRIRAEEAAAKAAELAMRSSASSSGGSSRSTSSSTKKSSSAAKTSTADYGNYSVADLLNVIQPPQKRPKDTVYELLMRT
jgi:hypothetical protein